MLKNQIFIIYGRNPKEMIKELLENIKIEKEVDKNYSIGLKPNLVVAKDFSTGATTNPDIVKGIIEYLQDHDIYNITIMESSSYGSDTKLAFKVCGYNEISKKFNVKLLDLNDDKVESIIVNDLELKVCSTPKNVDYLINIPVLKAHCSTHITCALKNLKGCIPNDEKSKYHRLGLHKPIAFLNTVIKQNLVIVDGLNGDLTWEEGGTPVEMDRIIAGKDPVLIDAYASELIGYRASDIEYIKISESLGIGSMSLDQAKIIEFKKELKSKNNYSHVFSIKNITKYIVDNNACSVCYGSVIHALQRLNEKSKLNKINKKIFIGQGFINKSFSEIGVGNCTKFFTENIPGCPPKAIDIIKYLKDQYNI